MTATFKVGDGVRVQLNPATGIGGATGTVVGFTKRSALVRWTGGTRADWIATARLEHGCADCDPGTGHSQRSDGTYHRVGGLVVRVGSVTEARALARRDGGADG